MFDVSRFRRLLAVHWAERGRGYLWFLAIGCVVQFCVWLLITSAGTQLHSYSVDTQTVVFVFGYVLSSLLFTARFYSGIARRESALILLMRPASTLEKALLAFLIVAIFYPLAYMLVFQVCNVPGALLGEAARDALALTKPKDAWMPYLANVSYGPFLPFANPEAPWLELDLFLGMAGLQPLVLAGSLYFRRAAWLKTLVALFLLILVGIPLLAMATDADPFQLFHGIGASDPTPLLEAWRWVVWGGVLLLFWASTWRLLGERELQ